MRMGTGDLDCLPGRRRRGLVLPESYPQGRVGKPALSDGPRLSLVNMKELHLHRHSNGFAPVRVRMVVFAAVSASTIFMSDTNE